MATVATTRQEDCARDTQRCLAYAAVNGWAMTSTDVHTWLYDPKHLYTVAEVRRALQALCQEKKIVERRGCYTLPMFERVLDGEHRAFRDACVKMRRARRVAWCVARIPGVRGVAIGNTLAWEHTHADGDMDFFVVARRGTLWWVRFVAVLPYMLLRARPGVAKRHGVDFTFFVADTHLDLASLRHRPDDPYLAHWVLSLIWLADDGIADSFFRANQWAGQRLPFASVRRAAWYVRRRWPKWPVWAWRVLRVTGVLPFANRLAKEASYGWFPADIRSRINASTDVVVKDDVLKFHVTDKRLAIYHAWTEQCSTL